MSNTQGNLVNVAAKNQEPQQPVNTNNTIRPEEQTNWVTVDMEDPIAKEEAANFNPLRTAVILGIPDSIAGGDFENAYNVQADLKSDHLIEVTARLDAKAGILPSIENIKRDAEMARESGKPYPLQEGASYMLLGTVQQTNDSEVLSNLRIVSVETGVIVSAGNSPKTGDPEKLYSLVSDSLKDAWQQTSDMFQKRSNQ
ncbi:MAG: hypothetical protein VXZ96_07110 [Myxococcota bacterium]|nr:hypothetical protein [Myxococcota bacterium]